MIASMEINSENLKVCSLIDIIDMLLIGIYIYRIKNCGAVSRS